MCSGTGPSLLWCSKTATGISLSRRFFPEQHQRIEIVDSQRSWGFDADPGQFWLALEARRICKRAGAEPWERLWQTLRLSCEKEWAMNFPQYAVSKWIGHSITVSGRH